MLVCFHDGCSTEFELCGKHHQRNGISQTIFHAEFKFNGISYRPCSWRSWWSNIKSEHKSTVIAYHIGGLNLCKTGYCSWTGVPLIWYSAQIPWNLYLYHDEELMIQYDTFQPMGAQLSKKAVLPLAKILVTVSCCSSKIGPRVTTNCVAWGQQDWQFQVAWRLANFLIICWF